MFQLLRQGSWSLYSKSDYRWNAHGRARVGGFMMPQAVKDALEAKKKELNEEPPADLEWSYTKD